MTKRKLYLILQAVVCIALAVWLSLGAAAIYGEGTARKAEHPTESIYTPENVAELFAQMAPLLVPGAVLLIAGLVLGVKDENAEKPVKAVAVQPMVLPKSKRTGVFQVLLIVAAAGFILAGILNGSALDVLYKAIMICSECVGLG